MRRRWRITSTDRTSMEKSFDEENISDVLDKDAIEIIGSIRVSKEVGKIQYEIIRCPVCGAEAGRLSRTRAFCAECLKEFRHESPPKKNNKKYRYDKKTQYKPGVCARCLKERTIRVSYGLCGTCYEKRRLERKREREGNSNK